jgi:hypothetical protein
MFLPLEMIRILIPTGRFNQVTVSYDASKDEKVEALQKQRDAVQSRLRD